MPIKMRGARATGLPGIKLLRSGRYLVRSTKVDPRTGRRTSKTRVVATLADAVALRDKKVILPPKPKRQRVSDYSKSWIGMRVRRLEPRTAERYAYDLAAIIAAFGSWYLDGLSVADVRDWLTRRSERYAPATCNGRLRTLRVVLEDALADGLVAANVARRVPALPEGRTGGRRGVSLSVAQFRRFINAVLEQARTGELVSPDIARAVATAALTGGRRGEIWALRWTDHADDELKLERSVSRRREKSSKTDDPRRVAVVGPLADVLAAQRQWLLSGQHPGLSSGLVFPASARHALAGATRRGSDELSWYRSPSALDRPLRALCARAEVPELSAHALRRTFEHLLRAAGVEQLVRKAMAGWRTDRAQAIYATVDAAERAAAASQLERLVWGHSPMST